MEWRKVADELIEFLFDDYTVLGRYIELYDENEGTMEIFVSKDKVQEKIRKFFELRRDG
jgi:hypothetical protein